VTSEVDPKAACGFELCSESWLWHVAAKESQKRKSLELVIVLTEASRYFLNVSFHQKKFKTITSAHKVLIWKKILQIRQKINEQDLLKNLWGFFTAGAPKV
jgi:hypothetical protein